MANNPASPPLELAIAKEHIVETEFGWIFFWNSKQYLETGDFDYALVGGGPLIVDKREGSIHEYPASIPIEQIIKRCQKRPRIEE